eukprot:13180880-Alexandrium_andersonii.AAC.1
MHSAAVPTTATGTIATASHRIVLRQRRALEALEALEAPNFARRRRRTDLQYGRGSDVMKVPSH